MPLTLTPQLQFSERYIENTDTATNLHSEDYISSALASLRANYQFPHGHLRTNFSFESTYFTRSYFSNRLNGNQYGDLDYFYQERRWSAGIKGSLVSNRYGETVPQFNEGILTQSTEFHQETVGVQENYILTPRSDLSLNYGFTNNEYSSGNYLNSEIHSINSSLGYQFYSLDRFSLLGGASLFRYNSGFSYKSVTASAQWIRKLGETATLLVSSGVGETTGRRVTWLADLNYSKNFEEGSVQGGYSRNLGAGGGLANSIVVSQQVKTSIQKTLGRGLTGRISGNYGETFGAIPSSDFHLKFWNAGANLDYVLLRWLTGSLSYSHYYQQVEGRVSEILYSNQVFLSFSTNFVPWRPF